jgi:O-acetyl-ADP-ribose deacetylase (regulator of RNase III)
MGKVFECSFAGVTIEVVKGDITEEDVDAIVNAANAHLKHGGGVAGAIVRKGGRVIQEESDRIGYVPVGSAVYTGAGRLKARYVIHAVGPVWGEGEEEKKLRSAVRSALELAEKLGLASVSLPAISTGVFGYPKEEGTAVIVDEVLKFLKKKAPASLRLIRFIDIDTETVDLFRKRLEQAL